MSSESVKPEYKRIQNQLATLSELAWTCIVDVSQDQG